LASKNCPLAGYYFFDFGEFLPEKLIYPQTEGIDAASVQSAADKSDRYPARCLVCVRKLGRAFGQTFQLRF
jgi:hypothetical protein